MPNSSLVNLLIEGAVVTRVLIFTVKGIILELFQRHNLS